MISFFKVLACIIANLPGLSVGLAMGFSAILIPQVYLIKTRAIYVMMRHYMLVLSFICLWLTEICMSKKLSQCGMS